MTGLKRAERDLRRAAACVTLVVAGCGTEPVSIDSSFEDAAALFEQRTPGALTESFDLFEDIVEREPDNALAHAGVASSGCLLALYSVVEPGQVLPRARQAAEEALRLDPTLSEAHSALGLVDYLYAWDWQSAEARFRTALDLDPASATAWHWYGMLLTALGRTEEAVAALDRAAELAPESRIIQAKRGTVLTAAGRYEEAQAQLAHAAEKFPTLALPHRELGFLYLELERYEDAVAAFERAAELAGGASKSTGGLGYAYAVVGEEERARKVLDVFLERSRSGFVPPMYLALMYAGLGETDEAFRWLERAHEMHDPGLVYLAIKPGFESLRTDPRFVELAERIGLDPP